MVQTLAILFISIIIKIAVGWKVSSSNGKDVGDSIGIIFKIADGSSNDGKDVYNSVSIILQMDDNYAGSNNDEYFNGFVRIIVEIADVEIVAGNCCPLQTCFFYPEWDKTQKAFYTFSQNHKITYLIIPRIRFI